MLSRRLRTRRDDADRGFTTVELAVVLLIMLTVLALLGNVLLSLTRASNQGEALVANEQQVHLAVLQLGRDLRAANPLNALSSSSSYAGQVKVTLQVPNGARIDNAASVTSGSAVVSSPTAAFTAADVGDTVTGVPILWGTTIVSVTDGQHAVLSQGVMATASNVTLTYTPTSVVTWLYDTTGSTCGKPRSICRRVTVNGGTTSTLVEVTNVGNSASQPVFSYLNRFGIAFSSAATPGTVALCTTKIRVDVVGQADPNPKAFEMAQDIQLRNQLSNLQYAGNNPC